MGRTSEGARGVSATQELDPFGNPIPGSQSLGIRAGFTGHEMDRNSIDTEMTDGTALSYNFGARSYVPATGRFLTPDPARDPSSWSLYGYAGNSPMMFVDPDGREVKEKVHEVALGNYHTSTVVIPEDQDRYRDDKRFKEDPESGKVYVTFGAGPDKLIGGKLVSGTNRENDADLSNEAESFGIDIGDQDENAVIEKFFTIEESYRQGTEQVPVDYDLFPAPEGSRRNPLIADDSFNSNSWNRGFLEAAGLTVPRPTLRVPGFDKPLPPGYFGVNPDLE